MQIFELTPTQRAAAERSRAFRQSINARAVRQSEPPQRSFGVKGYQHLSEPKKIIPPEPEIIWPAIPMPDKMTIARIQKGVAKAYSVTVLDLQSVRRTHDVVMPRQIAMWIAKALTPLSLPEIGRRFGNRDHTTALHAVRKIEAMMRKDSKFASTVNALKNTIEAIG
jgi:hypothetical protein